LLTPRQTEVVQLVAAGLPAKQIARRLGVSKNTVDEHLAEARRRAGASTTCQLVSWAVSFGLAGLLPSAIDRLDYEYKEASARGRSSSNTIGGLVNLRKTLTGSDPELVIDTSSGQAHGFMDRGVRNWRGIPYGQVVGRFRPAIPAPREAQVEATSWGAVNWQMPMWSTSLDAVTLSHLLPGTAESEACLNLNIWSPPSDVRAPYPVLVWLHPGQHMIGGNLHTDDPWALTARHDVLMVTANYRLGPWGWLHLQTLESGFDDCVNLGVRDQLLLLRWIHDNIAQFGGDPNNVTVAGLSTGGSDVAALLGMPSAHGLFHKAAIYSGNAEMPITVTEAAAFATRFLAAVGPLTPTAENLATVPNVALRYIHRQLLSDGKVPYEAVVDGDILPQPPLEQISGGLSADIPVLVSVTSEEAQFLNRLPWNAVEDRYAALPQADPRISREEKIEVFSRLMFVEPASQLLAALNRGGGHCWAQVFDYQPTTSVLAADPRTAGRAAHSSDLAALFFDVAGTAGNDTDRTVCAREQQALIALARHGELPWPRYTAQTPTARWFSPAEPSCEPLRRLPGQSL